MESLWNFDWNIWVKYWNLFRNKPEIWANQLQCAKKCSVSLDQEVLVKNMANLRVPVWMICL